MEYLVTDLEKFKNLSFSIGKNINDYSLKDNFNTKEIAAVFIIKGCQKYLEESGDAELFKLLQSLKLNFLDVDNPSQLSVLLNIGLLNDEFECLTDKNFNNIANLN